MLRRAALDIITALKVEGGCNCQFALNPDSFEYAVIEVNPRVSRSSALGLQGDRVSHCQVRRADRHWAIPWMKCAMPLRARPAPALNRRWTILWRRLPKWPFDKFVYGKRTLGTQMKATGEVMAIGVSVEQALMKAVRGAEIGCDTLRMKKLGGAVRPGADGADWPVH